MVMPVSTQRDWQDFLANTPNSHILQSPAWGELKSLYGWEPSWLISGDLGAQVLFQDIPLGYSIAYLPLGPVSLSEKVFEDPGWSDFQQELDHLCREKRAVFLKIEPDCWEHEGCHVPEGFQKSSQSIQPPRTILISLEGSEEQILGRMKSKTRYNIRLATKKGVTAAESDDLETFYNLLENTSVRADFGIHTADYYRDVYRLLQDKGECQLFLAEFEGEPLASIMVFKKGERSWYFYGASSSHHREKMPTYLVQWEAIRWAKNRGCTTYDLWGVPDHDLDFLEANFTKRSDGLWGVYRFKRGFGGNLVRSCGAWDRVYLPVLYQIYLMRTKINLG
jgi:lipid II:glycine glycyltransferase (peptidoglycan interpeptide bridge formation enzyme)